MKPGKITGGCQCGAVRYEIEKLGRASICHCRMCQKAFGNFFGPLVTAEKIVWKGSERATFHSSNRNWRGFCSNCGTPLTYEHEGVVEISIGSLDQPEQAAPTVQVNASSRCSFTDFLSELPEKGPANLAADEDWNAGVISNQFPDQKID